MSTNSVTPNDPRRQAFDADMAQRMNQLPSQPVTADSSPQSQPVVTPPAVTDPAKPLSQREAFDADIAQRMQTLPNSREDMFRSDIDRRIRRTNDVISGTSFLEKALDVVNTPQQFLFGALTKQPQEDLLQAGIRGTRENTRFADVLERELGADPNSWATKIGGFSGDVLFDPLLVLGGPITKGISKGLGLVGKAGISAAETIAPELSARLFESAVKPAVRLFSKTAFAGAAEKELVPLIDLELTKAQARAGRIMVEENAQRQIATDLAKQLGVPESQMLSEVARRVEVKTGSQLAFPFATMKESTKILTAPQLDLFEGLKGELGREFAVTGKAVEEVAQDVGQGLAEQLPAGAEREIASQVVSMKQRLENALVREQSFGLKTARLEDSTVDYLTHLTTPEAKKLIAKLPAFANLGREFNPRHAFQLARELDESHPAIAAAINAGESADIPTLNRLWQEGKLFPQLGPQDGNLFITDPYVASAVRRLRGEKAIADAEILIKSAGNPHLAIPKGASPADWRPLRLPESAQFDRLRSYTDKFRFEPDVAGHLEQTIQKTLLPEGLDTFLKGFDTIQGIWKGLTLHLFPSYHTRNAVGNVWNNYLAGLDNPKWYLEALKAQAGTVDSLTVAGEVMPLARLRTMMEDYGITGSTTFAQAETLRNLTPSMGKRVFATAEYIPVLGKAVTFGLKHGTEIESNARIAHFLWQLDKGASPAEAAVSTKTFLFDYSAQGMTGFEQSVMRRVMPFYSWTRFNIPLQIESLVSNPRPYVRLSELVNTIRTKGSPEFEKAAAEYRGEDAPYLAQFIKDNSGVPFRMGPSGEPEYFLLGGWLPAGDLNVLGSKGGLLDKVSDLITPFLKTPIEQATNFDMFLQRPIEQYKGETQRFLGIEMRKRAIQLLRNVRILSESDRVLRSWKSQDELEPDQQSKLSAITRLLFGLKGYSPNPAAEIRKQRYDRQDTRRQLQRAMRNDLPSAASMLSGQLSGEETD